MNDYINVLKKYAVFEGRARRREYWMFTLINTIIMMALYVPVIMSVFSGMAEYQATGIEPQVSGLVSVLGGLFGIYALATFIPTLAVTVRRLHDTGKSGWMILVALIPVLGLIVFVFMCLDSQPGTNQYGENPKGQ